MTPWSLPYAKCDGCGTVEDSGDEQAPLSQLLDDLDTQGWSVDNATDVRCPQCNVETPEGSR